MKLIDSHAHLDNEKFDEDRLEVLDRIEEELDFVVNIGYDLKSSRKSVEYADKYPYIYATVGIHPTEIKGYSKDWEEELEKLAKNEKVLAIGEIGLDYYWMTEPKDVQKDIFKRQLELAKRVKKPVVIHSRDAMKDTLDILKEFPDVKGVFHCYPGSIESAREIISNYYLGIGGVLTFKNAEKLVEVVKEIPLEKIVIETDCPYMAPVPMRGKRNEPVYVKYVAEKIAEIKGIGIAEVIKVTNENTRKAYNML